MAVSCGCGDVPPLHVCASCGPELSCGARFFAQGVLEVYVLAGRWAHPPRAKVGRGARSVAILRSVEAPRRTLPPCAHTPLSYTPPLVPVAPLIESPTPPLAPKLPAPHPAPCVTIARAPPHPSFAPAPLCPHAPCSLPRSTLPFVSGPYSASCGPLPCAMPLFPLRAVFPFLAVRFPPLCPCAIFRSSYCLLSRVALCACCHNKRCASTSQTQALLLTFL